MATAEQIVGAVLDATNKRYVVETGSLEDGNSHFTLYSDGWLEQSGSVTNGFSGLMTIQMPKPFKDKKYVLNINREDAFADRDGLNGETATNYGDKTESSFSISLYSPDTVGAASWVAKGYSI